MNQRHAAGEPEPLQPPHQELRGIAVLGEDDHLVIAEPRIAEHLLQFVELGLIGSCNPGSAPCRGETEP